MPQLKLYLSQDLADEVRRRATARNLSVSAFLAELVKRAIDEGWPENFFTETLAAWQGEPFRRPPQGDLEKCDKLW
jgi:hypothetical protein